MIKIGRLLLFWEVSMEGFFYEEKGSEIAIHQGNSLEFSAHLHNHIELVGMVDGVAQAFVDTKKYELKSGDAFIVFPNQIHRYQKIGEENYIIFIFPVNYLTEYQSIFNNKLPVESKIENALEDKEILHAFQRIGELNEDKGRSDYIEIQIKGYFLILLGKLLGLMKLEDIKKTDTNTVRLILNYCIQHYTENLLLSEVAKELHISKYYISHLFGDKLHIGFGAYIRMLRVDQACRLLESGDKSITEIAYEVGFNSTRSFNRVFLNYMRMTPKDYQKERNK